MYKSAHTITMCVPNGFSAIGCRFKILLNTFHWSQTLWSFSIRIRLGLSRVCPCAMLYVCPMRTTNCKPHVCSHDISATVHSLRAAIVLFGRVRVVSIAQIHQGLRDLRMYRFDKVNLHVWQCNIEMRVLSTCLG